MLVAAAPEVVPEGMDYLEFGQAYAVARAPHSALTELYEGLDDWIETQSHAKGYPSDFSVELYRPTDSGEDVEVFLPLLQR